MFNLKGNICILGDSIVYGAWDEEKHGYVNRLREDLKENNQVENIYGLGIPGETTAGLLKRIDTELKSRKPNTIIIGIGINDTIYIKNKQQEAINIKEYDDVLKDYCNTNKVQYLKLFDILQQTDFSTDGIHPNEKGHEKIYKAIKMEGEK